MKRVRSIFNCVANCTRSKRPKLNNGLHYIPKRKYWVTPTQVKNYMMRDTLVDWLQLHNKIPQYNNSSIMSRKNETGNDFINFIKNKGIEFENKLVSYINKNKTPVVSISNYITDKSVKKTIELMKSGVPVLHSVPLQHNGYRTRGIADLVVRSDYVGKIVNENPLKPEEEIISAPNLTGQYHYVVIDIKFSTLPLRADGRHLLNSGNYSAYKAQTWIYNRMIGDIQGYIPQFSYILGRRWSYYSHAIRHKNLYCLDKLGVIDFNGIDQDYISRTNNAIKWYRDVKQNGDKWQVSPVPSRPELYPNMSINSGKWNKQKEQISKNIGEITTIWYLGVKERKNALDHNVTSWKDPRCTSEILGVNGTRALVINEIMKINRQNEDRIRPNKINTDLYDWKMTGNEMFVDFETLVDIFSSFDELPKQEYTNQIFMIGVWYKHKDNWVYKNFICHKLSIDEEFRIMNEFVNFVSSRGYPKLWYWHAEKNIWNQAEKRQFNNHNFSEKNDIISNQWKDIYNWCDLAKIFRSEPIVIKGCFNFGLKNIVTAMNSHGLIDTIMESKCTSGTSAAIKAWNVYKNNSDPVNSSVIKDISKYNKFDVKALYDIITYLRKNH